MTLIEHIKALNAKSAAWVAEDPLNRMSLPVVEDAKHWADYGIHTVEDFNIMQDKEYAKEIRKNQY